MMQLLMLLLVQLVLLLLMQLLVLLLMMLLLVLLLLALLLLGKARLEGGVEHIHQGGILGIGTGLGRPSCSRRADLTLLLLGQAAAH
jgi:hypothetical protein